MAPDRRVVIVPGRADLVDAGFLLALGSLAVVEFRSTYAGWDFLVVTIISVVLGILIAHLANALRQPFIVLALMGLAAFFLLGGAISLRHAPNASALPTGGTLQNLASEAIHGWRDLLTTVPPVDGTGPLLVLPYILGLLCGLGGFALARRTRGAFWPALVPLAVFATVILLGSGAPADLAQLACLFALASLVWAVLRDQRLRPAASSGSARRSRLVTAGALLAVAGAGGYFVGPHVPGSGSHARVVLRQYVHPPSNIGNYPSPLAEYRLYAGQQKVNGDVVSLANKTLFTVGGSIPAGTPIRFATLDSYNDIVWAASDNALMSGTTPDTFLKVGPTLNNPAPGPAYTMTVKIDSYDDYWMPDAGAVQAVIFADADHARQAEDFRYNLATGTGIVPGKLAAGATYTLRVAGVKPRMLSAADSLASDGYSDAGAFLKPTALALAGGTGSTARQVLRIAAGLRSTGSYSHGDTGSGFEFYLPGHAVGRLTDFVKGLVPGQLYVGDDEQYAAAYALMIQQLGVPARVVVGVLSMPAGGVVKGSDVDAWVEARDTDGGWLTIPTNQFLDKNKPPAKQLLQQQHKPDPGSIVPPPVQGRPKATLAQQAQSESNSRDRTRVRPKSGWFAIPGWLVAIGIYVGLPIIGIAAVLGGIVATKAWRRSRRRSRGSPGLRLSYGWRELTDHARDLGSTIPRRSTRREQARAMGPYQVGSLARLADEHIFGGTDITEADVRSFWDEVASSRGRMSAAVGRWRRLRAAVSPVTLFPGLPGAVGDSGGKL